MKKTVALIALKKMNKTKLVKTMILIVKSRDNVPLWIQNEIDYYNKSCSYSGTGGTNGNAAIMEDIKYHGGYVE